MNNFQKQWIDQKELAAIVGTSVNSLNTLRYKGKLKGIPFVKWGNRYKYPIEEVQKWIKEQTQTDSGDYYGNK